MRVKVPDLASDPKIRKRLSDYVGYWMKENLGLTKPSEMEALANKRQLKVSDATVGNILNQKDFKMGTEILRNLSMLLGRPPEELYLLAIGRATWTAEDGIERIIPMQNGDGIEQQLTTLAETYPNIADDEKRKYWKWQLEQMIRLMNAAD